jgi:60 kDa SS-A/Ro ribonucleoprotein
MANKSVFATIAGKLLPSADARNHEGAQAYRLSPEQALAQLAATGTFNATFYAEPRDQLDESGVKPPFHFFGWKVAQSLSC